jgi:hypothetical protein
MYTSYFSKLIATTTLALVIFLVSCAPAATPQPINTPEPPTSTPDLKQALVGSWTSIVTKEDILQAMPDFHQEALCDNTGTFNWQFNADGTFMVDQTALPECPVPADTHFEDIWVLDGNQITFAKGTPEEEIYEIAIDGGQLTFKVVSSECPPCIAVNTANPWTRVE